MCSPLRGRQYIAHGHVAVSGKKVSAPSYAVSFAEEGTVDWFKKPIGAEANAVKTEVPVEVNAPAEVKAEEGKAVQ